MFQAPDPKSPLFDMVRGIVNAQAALVRGLPAEPAQQSTTEPIDHGPGVVVTRIEFAAGHEDARLTNEQVAALMRKVRLAPKLLEALKEWVEPWGNAAFLPESKISRHRALIAEAEGRSPQEPA